MLLFTWGLFKKVVIADRFALYADQVFNNVHEYTGLPLLIGVYFYAFQIYFDFSGYTDMARGIGRIFGMNLTENFNRPYLAISVADFWRRWHISFSNWILDYIFKPLQMGWRDWGQAGTALALLVTFIISGIWHGATWGFVIWGLLHGIYLSSSTYFRSLHNRVNKRMSIINSNWYKYWQRLVTFNLISIAWIFFRANNINEAWSIILKAFAGFGGIKQFLLYFGGFELIVLLVSLFFYNTVSLEIIENKKLYAKSNIIRWGIYLVIVASCQLFSVGNDKFIYLGF